MQRAVELAEQCETEPGRADESPKLGAVAVSANNVFLAEAHRGALGAGDHAEYCMIASLGEGSGALKGATVYTTLEPCTERTQPKIPCAQRLINEGVAVVYIGMLDPDARVRELGWKLLRDNGVEPRDFTEDLREKLSAMNAPFLERFRVGTGPQGSLSFDYMQNAGRMEIRDTESGAVFATEWSKCGNGLIHAVSPPGRLALAKTARSFDDIDDPGVYEFAGHAKTVRVGQIVMFKRANGLGYALVRVDEVLADPYTRARVTWELRLPD